MKLFGEQMNFDLIKNWIAKRQVEHFLTAAKGCEIDDFHKIVGAHNILEELRKWILIQENLHNREDIKKLKEKQDEI